MKILKFILRVLFYLVLSLIFLLIILKLFSPILNAESLNFPYSIHPFDICKKIPTCWEYIKIIFIISCFFNLINLFNSIFYLIFIKHKKYKLKKLKKIKVKKTTDLHLLVGKTYDSDESIFINEKGLFQNILITGTIGTGKTSSAMYPFTEQLIKYKSDNKNEKIGMLILDVKGNFYKQVQKYTTKYNRNSDLIVLELRW